MRAPTDTEQPIAQMGNNLIKSSLFEGAELAARCAGGRPKVWHGAAVTEGVRQARNARPLSEFVQKFGFAHFLLL